MAKKQAKSSKDLVTQALLLGFGFMDMGRKKADKFFKDLKHDRGITKGQSEKAVKDFIKEIDKQKIEIARTIRKRINNFLEETDPKKTSNKRKTKSSAKKRK